MRSFREIRRRTLLKQIAGNTVDKKNAPMTRYGYSSYTPPGVFRIRQKRKSLCPKRLTGLLFRMCVLCACHNVLCAYYVRAKCVLCACYVRASCAIHMLRACYVYASCAIHMLRGAHNTQMGNADVRGGTKMEGVWGDRNSPRHSHVA